ncbi:MAG: sporulation protein YabP [Wujia sp.]
MESGNNSSNHRVVMSGRNSCEITGVSEVLAFDEQQVSLHTSEGKLTIKGNSLHVSGLDVDKGQLKMTGNIDSMNYSEIHSAGRATKKILGRMFK